MVADKFEAGRQPASNQIAWEFGRELASLCQFAASKLDDKPNFRWLQLRISFEPASVMEFGFNTVIFSVMKVVVN